MDMINDFHFVNGEGLSVEANIDGYNFLSNQNNTVFESDISSLFNTDLFGPDSTKDPFCDPIEYFASATFATEPNEFDKYLGPAITLNATSDIDQNLLVINTLPIRDIVEKPKTEKANKVPIFLSTSVGIGESQAFFGPAPKIEIAYDLEETYRPRYKSDYFAQNGRNRKPRYVTDRLGNHYVTLKIPFGIRGQIRVDWVTVLNEKNKRYFMPYKFQASNDSADIADCNPIKIDIGPDAANGEMKLYLVLIKTKQDMLKVLQPLRPYQPMKDAMDIVDKYSPEDSIILTPKKLIKKHQLGKSQLAFTLCPLGSDGQTCVADWNTTVFSSIIEEETNEVLAGKTIACPNCSVSLVVDDDGMMVEPIVAKKRKSFPMANEKIKTMKKSKEFSNAIYCVI